MLDIKYLREHVKEIKTNCANRLAKVDIDLIIKLDSDYRASLATTQALREERNAQSKTKPTPEIIERMKTIGNQIQAQENAATVVQEKLFELLLAVPNLTHNEVKISTNEDDNVILEQVGEPTAFDFTPLDHLALAEKHDWLELDRATKVTGAKFYYLKGDLARLELALINYTIDIITKHGYEFVTTPDLAKTDLINRLGFSPRGESTQVYNLADSDLSLIGTAEITLGGLYADETLKASELPKKYVGLSHCYRTEAGSYSKFSKGLFRVHQFSKVEMFVFAEPEVAESIHQEILDIEKEIFNGLEIPYKVIDHCTADLGNPSFRTFDLEAWMPGKPAKDETNGDWAEVTSTSNCTDYQARGLNIKYDNGTERNYLYTLNGTGIATTRGLIAILENHQQADGSIKVPKALQPYLDNKQVL
ncbi:serine--tRNA ligase [Candidatus Falkowbacteria bacterium CG10_big_fil_rev_8_21_14_0_10_37_14]|uniref:Serine--tRNA ligase n=1 Tax=Candidatus Falkowbacteria bacterium CG10_big_fil_rev_8_21_14_0_10_37_14 TaxID=1974561 RepID=A0A2M6WSH5_9BACT|nr:serine--tRNA ligase [Candidatus Falkowbacteria bacterium]PIT95763.1 MAG: serine--tRNA ligase [Candidatus Falkowbacteria bacterium CG10_big_fil_rev_8_21_14_0_10_37_14]